ncbi:MAG: hypothetical protein IJW59_01295 [Clostridia bacterium]|nr:hypothetical protein [Clostridia bacterium]
MKVTKKCGICGYNFTYDDNVYVAGFIRPASEGAKYYYDLWHFFAEECPECGYSCKDVSKTFYKKIINDPNYSAVDDNVIIKELKKARPNRVDLYVKSSIYYQSIGENYLSAISMLQAGDLVYAELMYWEEFVFDNTNSVSALINKSQYNEIKKYADKLYLDGVALLEDVVKDDPQNIDAQLLLAGTLSDGNKIQVMRAVKILNSLKSVGLTKGQKSALEFLLDDLN